MYVFSFRVTIGYRLQVTVAALSGRHCDAPHRHQGAGLDNVKWRVYLLAADWPRLDVLLGSFDRLLTLL